MNQLVSGAAHQANAVQMLELGARSNGQKFRAEPLGLVAQ